MSTVALAIVPTPALPPEAPATTRRRPVYEIEKDLAALIEEAEGLQPDQEPAFVSRLLAAFDEAREKRDACAWWLAQNEADVALCDAEIARLKERKASLEHRQERFEAQLVALIQSLPRDRKGKFQKLEGNTSTFALRACPASVEVTDANQIPDEFIRVTLSLPATTWTWLLDALDVEAAARIEEAGRPKREVSKSAVKAALDADRPVAGAHLVTDRYSLRRS